MKNFLIICCLSACIVPCASAQILDYATLVMYRPSSIVGAMVNYKVLTGNDSLLYIAKNNSRQDMKIYKEGLITFYTKLNKKFASIDVKFGQIYYLRCGLNFGLLIGNPDLQFVSEDMAKKENVTK